MPCIVLTSREVITGGVALEGKAVAYAPCLIRRRHWHPSNRLPKS